MSDLFRTVIPAAGAPRLLQNRYRTQLTPQEEYQFAQWVQKNKIPFDPGPLADYDMRGFWKAMVQGQAHRAENLHFPDIWKTPFHRTFSNESIYAYPGAPHWEENKLIDRTGKVLVKE